MFKNIVLYICVLLSSITIVESREDMSKWLRPAEVPQPENNLITPQRVELGKLLYFDTRLSSSGKVSCATCHHPKQGWTDALPSSKAVGVNGAVGERNSATLLNVAYQKHQFWDGRAQTLEEQVLGPIEADNEMNMPLKKLMPLLRNIQEYAVLFKEAYPDEGITKESLAKAIASFERTIVSPLSPFDKYAMGKKDAISEDAKKGFALFKGKAACVSCHDGFNFSDGSFHNIGLNKGKLQGKELGRYLTKNRASWYGVMKTPTLRDATKSAPYFHDGSVYTLHEATHICASGGRHEERVKNQSKDIKDRHLSREEIHLLVVFMESLSGPDLDVQIPQKFPQ